MRICPVCKSPDVENDLSVQSLGSGEVFNRLRCRKCGYSGVFFPEIRDDKKPKQPSQKRRKKR
ncbi:MAG TPA: hypothetical protein ENN46_04450 [Candidatus Woesearchaeota archaeon]|nr:hypothetical protein [Candidatus Woesearchaeota archaeon]